jgi:hypothetical protein
MPDWLRRIGGNIERAADLVGDRVEQTVSAAAKDVQTTAARVSTNVTNAVKVKDYVEPVDGFVSFDPASGAVLRGRAPGVRVRDALPGRPGGAPQILAGGDSNEPVRFRLAGADVQRKTNKGGNADLPLSMLGSAVGGLPPKRGGLIPVSAEAIEEKTTVEARVLALPKDYDGPIFISDIDETLRMTSTEDVLMGKEQKPIAGAKEILDGVAGKGVPIVYLSAATSGIAAQNKHFLGKNFPAGILLDNPGFGMKDVKAGVANHAESARLQAEHKTKIIAELKAAYPNAQLFGFGDDKWGDAVAYQKSGVRAYIHDVRPGDENIPSGFNGVKSKDYDAPFRSRIQSDLDAAIRRSRSFTP